MVDFPDGRFSVCKLLDKSYLMYSENLGNYMMVYTCMIMMFLSCDKFYYVTMACHIFRGRLRVSAGYTWSLQKEGWPPV